MEIRKGEIINFIGSWGSGLGFLVIQDSETEEIEQVPCDNGPTVRALENCFGNVITPDHTANGNGYNDKEIFWSMGELGFVLGGFTPVEDASPELIEAYENQKTLIKKGG
ncbi:MAG: hypothetical protein E3J87_00780 [Candidatus Cloacimonadota bacterium]|nr:MAG: hypothetical protein E3J87_10765 [Candidatus Cloacimonadota bacterium]TES94182.1 MAG: hypothetical protein E3J87_00780 [Candidatus Cloacimonadota bacterium]